MINNSGYHIQSKDASSLADNMITAEKMLPLNNEMVRFDLTSKQPLHHGSGGKNKGSDCKHGRSAQRKRNDHGQQNQKRLN